MKIRCKIDENRDGDELRDCFDRNISSIIIGFIFLTRFETHGVQNRFQHHAKNEINRARNLSSQKFHPVSKLFVCLSSKQLSFNYLHNLFRLISIYRNYS